jgi:DNA-binding NarL/FixJ family response regulator
MALFETALHRAQQGVGQFILLAGEAGVGKSRLLGELRRRAVADGFTILEGHCFEQDLDFPYAPLIDALRAFLASGSPHDPAGVEHLGVLAMELVKLLPELALTNPSLQPTPALTPEAEKRRLFEALLRFFVTLTQGAEPHPLLLIFEDIHWGDETSLDFLHLLARRIMVSPILLLATYRREDASAHLTHLLAQLDRARLAHEVMLQPLSVSDIDLMLQAIFSLNRPVRPEFLDAIYTLTEGNPFFTEEVLKALVTAGDLFYADGTWDRKPIHELQIPRSVQDAVQRRTAQLTAGARQLLTLAAVAGQRFDVALLQQVAGFGEAELLALLKELVAAQLVMEETADQFAFRHALTRQAVYAELLARERQAHHRAIAEVIERMEVGAPDAQAAGLAYHWTEAGEWAKSLVYARRAGERAQALYAPRAAVEHFTRALLAAHHLPQMASLAALYQGRGLAFGILGEFAQARLDLEAALAQARAAGEPQAEWRALLELGKLWASRDYGQAGDCFQAALALARTLDDPAALARSLNRVGNWHINLEQPAQAVRCHQEALAIFQTLNERHGLARTFDLLGTVYLVAGDLAQSAAHLSQAVALFQALDEREGLASTLINLAICGGNYTTDVVVPAALTAAECEGLSGRALQIAREIDWRAGEAYALSTAGCRVGAQGRVGEALQMMQQALAVAQEIEHRQWMCVAHRDLGVLHLDLLALPAAQQHLTQAQKLAKELNSVYLLRTVTARLVTLRLMEENVSDAAALLVAELDPHLPLQTLGQRRLWQAQADVALARHDPHQALQIADRLAAAAANLESSAVGQIPTLVFLRGRALAALRRWVEAEATLHVAQAAARAQGARGLLWRIEVALAKLYQAQARPGEAARAKAAARQIIEEFAGNLPDPALRDNFLHQAAGLLSFMSQPPIERLPAGLTAREVEVLRLVAQGATNRQIAEALTISARTVNTHLTNIFNKIGCENRTAATAFALQNGLVNNANE